MTEKWVQETSKKIKNAALKPVSNYGSEISQIIINFSTLGL